jgi:nucleotide-binding universal stress UspA family protein
VNILVAYDGSKAADNALKLAGRYAGAFGAKVHIVTSMKGGHEVPRDDFEKAEKKLSHAGNLVKKEGISCETHLTVRGFEPGEDLIEYAKENRIDQIIVGIKKRSKVGKLVFGSTAQYVILEAPCPVVSVK